MHFSLCGGREIFRESVTKFMGRVCLGGETDGLCNAAELYGVSAVHGRAKQAS